MLHTWGPLYPKIWGGGWGGGIDKKSDLSLQKSKKSIFFPKSGGGGGRPPAPPAADPMAAQHKQSVRKLDILKFCA